MKSTKSSVLCQFRSITSIQFEEQNLTSFAGLVLFHQLFNSLNLKSRLRQCFQNRSMAIFSPAVIVLLLVVHLLLGYRELRHVRYYHDDPLVRRILGLKCLPSVATISRTLAAMTQHEVNGFQNLMTEYVLTRLKQLALHRVTLDFDGTVISTARHAEGSAVGFNKQKRGQRSYYPLFCTVAQTDQVLHILHRSGNVHDINGARAVILHCIQRVKAALPHALIELRMDSAFFSEDIISMLDQLDNVEYSISVPFARYAAMKCLVDECQNWIPINKRWDYFETDWKPKQWGTLHRFMFYRQETKIQHKKPLQLDLFLPYDYGYTFKAIITNKPNRARHIVEFHNGRGSQERLFAALKSENQMQYVPTNTWNGNQIYLLSTALTHNLARELQMLSRQPKGNTQSKRPALWIFEQLGTLRRRLIQRAGRIIKPQDRLTLSLSANAKIKEEMLHYLDMFKQAA